MFSGMADCMLFNSVFLFLICMDFSVCKSVITGIYYLKMFCIKFNLTRNTVVPYGWIGRGGEWATSLTGAAQMLSIICVERTKGASHVPSLTHSLLLLSIFIFNIGGFARVSSVKWKFTVYGSNLRMESLELFE